MLLFHTRYALIYIYQNHRYMLRTFSIPLRHSKASPVATSRNEHKELRASDVGVRIGACGDRRQDKEFALLRV
jgi:hypothetical protein